MESKKRVRKINPPKMRLELEKDVQKYVSKRINDHRFKIIMYLLSDPKIGLNAEPEEIDTCLEHKYERVKNYMREILTYRFRGEIILQEYPIGLSFSEGVRFVSPLIKIE